MAKAKKTPPPNQPMPLAYSPFAHSGGRGGASGESHGGSSSGGAGGPPAGGGAGAINAPMPMFLLMGQ